MQNTKTLQTQLTSTPIRLRHPRGGKVLVLMAILLPTLIGIAGLVFDSGLMMCDHRDLQHAADAAATAAAMDLAMDKGALSATETAIDLIENGHGLTGTTVQVKIPPESGPYTGQSKHVEVVVGLEYQSHFMHILDSVFTHQLSARAVAGVQEVTSDAAVVVLDPDPADLTISGIGSILSVIDIDALTTQSIAQSGVSEILSGVPIIGPVVNGLLNASLTDLIPNVIDDIWSNVLGNVAIAPIPALMGGLEVEGLGRLRVDGSILVNTQWGGVDENGEIVGFAASPPYGIACMPILSTTRILARDIRVVGGVDNHENYHQFSQEVRAPLQAGRLAVPDPYGSLPTPSVTSDPHNVSTTTHLPADAVRIALPTDQATDLLTGVLSNLSALLKPLLQPLIGSLTEALTTHTLEPGVYNSITALSPLGGVRFLPGVYIIRGTSPVTNMSLCIIGPVEADGVLFYLTDNSNFSATTGLPDSSEETNTSPPNLLSSTLPSALLLPLLSGAHISGLNDPGSPFDGMLIFQRQLDRRPIIIEAQQLLGSGDLSGTIYSKWGHVCFLGGFGSYDLKFVCGALRILTVNDTTIAPIDLLPAAKDVLLLE